MWRVIRDGIPLCVLFHAFISDSFFILMVAAVWLLSGRMLQMFFIIYGMTNEVNGAVVCVSGLKFALLCTGNVSEIHNISGQKV